MMVAYGEEVKEGWELRFDLIDIGIYERFMSVSSPNHLHRTCDRTSNRGLGRISLDWGSRLKIAIDLDGCVSDAGLAPLKNYIPSKHRGLGYRAPEMIETRKATQKSDVYSFIILLLEMLTGRSPIQISGHGNDEIVDLPRWVSSVVREEWTAEVFDVEPIKY
ncbi:hypothetical protein POM88_015959 [Heracleum sosnowskyi]|uniref:Protein kinase domain-containing protein n=1 Tax=Heracleum sosnowskyi TaxID=360622 RepID=A0AAD8MWC1_9APIA|nr:hypothetical protein POM88_015959 [Heracleum sosnowskyi]